jgi:hypothetical protein
MNPIGGLSPRQRFMRPEHPLPMGFSRHTAVAAEAFPPAMTGRRAERRQRMLSGRETRRDERGPSHTKGWGLFFARGKSDRAIFLNLPHREIAHHDRNYYCPFSPLEACSGKARG